MLLLTVVVALAVFVCFRETDPPPPTTDHPGWEEAADQPTRPPARSAAQERVSGPTAASPEISPAGGRFLEEITVEVTARSPAAAIHFTLDGSEPTPASREYSGPIPIDSTSLLKVKCFEPGLAPSPTVAQTFTLLDSSVAEFTSNLPLVIINTFGLQVSKERSVPASFCVIDAGEGRSSLTGPSDFDGRCDIKRRGYSSLRFPKRSFTVKTRDGSGQPLGVSLLGMPADTDWVLYAPYSDKSLIRDVLAYELSNKMGRYAARTRFVEVFVARTASKLAQRDYVGVYVLEEKIKRSKDRVNLAKLNPEDNSEPNISGGYIFKRDHTTPPAGARSGFFGPGSPFISEPGFTTGRGLHLLYVEPGEAEISRAQKKWLGRYLNDFEKALYGSNFKHPTQGYARYLDVDSFIDQFWIVELSKNIDGFRYSCYMSKDRGGKILLEPIWDWNLSFGNANYHEGWMPDQWYWRLLRDSEVCWYRRLREDPDFMQRLTDRWVELRQHLYTPEHLFERIDAMAEQLAEAQVRNFKRWPILGQSVNPNWYVGETYEDEIEWMKNWIQERIAWIDQQFVSPPSLSRSTSSRSGPIVTLKSPDRTIYYTVDGSDPRLPGGEVSPTARRYSEPILLQPDARVFARVRSGERWSGPALSPRPAPIAANR